MTNALKRHWILVTCIAFVLVNALLMTREIPWLLLLPAGLFLAWAMVARPDKLMLFIAFATPLSLNLEELDLGGIGVAIPTEPLLVALMLLFLLKLALEKGVLHPAVWRHPVTIVILLHLGWMALCIATSSMPIVSLKHWMARMWFVCTMFFLATRIFEEPRNMHRFIHWYLGGLAIVMAYTLAHHAQYGFAHEPGHWVMSPFFKDHTSYGAILAFFVPFVVSSLGMPGYSSKLRLVLGGFLVLLVTALVFSYTRAAWVSLVGAVGVFLVLKLRIPGWLIGAVALIAVLVGVIQQDEIAMALERNRVESSDDLGEHVKSISNVSSDASNLERINRWNSAVRMWEERPVFGWGPGTYMFQYAPFQASADRTIISTNFGVGGNAHSEFLGPLSEQGLPGALLMLALVAVISWTAVRLYKRLQPGADRRLVMVAFMGLITYFLHGLLNNFLDLDKASVPFWAFVAMIVVIDIRHREGLRRMGQA